MSLSPERAREFVEAMTYVRVYSGAIGFEDMVLAEGNVMSYLDAPSIELMHADGKLKSWSTRLRIEVAEPPHAWQEFNQHGNTCHHPGCTLGEDAHPPGGEVR